MVNENETENDATKAQGGLGASVAIGGDSQGNVVVGNHNTIIVRSKPEQTRADRNRSAMLELVQNTWVEGVLEKSLYHETLIDLGLEERPDAVTRPWDVQVQMPDRPKRVLPPGTPIVQVFDEAQGALLILGAPGAGKTTMLLELARDAIARARQDVSLPIPVVFNLSSWTNPKQPLTIWLVDELINKYHAPKKVAEGWVEQDELLLLLDGLDEVKTENREACVQAINIFRQAHGLTLPLVVGSRMADYEALSSRLQLRGAIFLQPLTNEQIDDYFKRAGAELRSVHHAWREDAELQELARQPLMLSIMTLAYRGAVSKALAGEQAGSLETRRKHLFDAYIQQMFTRVGRAKDERYTLQETTRYLTWLAHKLVEQGQSVFLIENMRRSWLSHIQQPFLRLMNGLITELVVVLVGGWLGWWVGWLLGQQVLGTLGAEMFGLAGMLMFGLVAGLMFGVFNVLMSQEVPTELMKWSWEKALEGLATGLSSGVVIGIGFGLAVGLLVAIILSQNIEKSFVVVVVSLMFGGGFGLVGGLVSGLLGGVAFGLETLALETKTVPNQGIQQSLANGLVFGMIFVLVSGVIFGIMFWWGFNLAAGWAVGLMTGLIFGLGGWFAVGGNAVINHYNLRFFLYLSQHIPSDYEHFLDYAVERLFLRRVGGSYVFVHRLLMEHFAEMWGKI